MSFRLATVFILILACQITCHRDAFKTLTTYEAKQRMAATVEGKQYRLLPLRIRN